MRQRRARFKTRLASNYCYFCGSTPITHTIGWHYSTMCDTGDGREGDLFAAAMERRIRTLENEINQNRLLTEKVLQGLDATFQASAVLSVEELRLLAQTEAAEIGRRRARQPPPPMSDFARSRVSKAVDGGRLQDLVEAAVGSGLDAPSYYGPPEGGAEGGGAQGGGAAGSGGLNQGWDWESQAYAADDDFLGGVHVEVAQPAELDIPAEERKSTCRKWLEEHGVTPLIDWGTLPQEQQKLWVRYSCDEIALELLAAARLQLPVKGPLKQAPPLRGSAISPGDAEEADADDVDPGDGELDEESEHRDGGSESLDGGVGRAEVSRLG